MTEQQITEFDRWFDQLLDPGLNLTPGDKELCRHAWQAALSHAEGETPISRKELRNRHALLDEDGRPGYVIHVDTVMELLHRAPKHQAGPSEPVAYRYRVKGQHWEVFDDNPCLDGHGANEEVQPLYTHPAPQVAVPDLPGEVTADGYGWLQIAAGEVPVDDAPTVLRAIAKHIVAAPTAPAGEPECCCGETEQAWRLCPEHGPGTKHDRQRLAAKQPVSDPDGVPDITSTVINDACWTFIEAMPHQLPAPIFNDLKPALYEALKHYHRAALPAPDEREIAATSITALQSAFYEGFEAGATEDDGDDAWERSSARLRAGKEGKGHA